MPVYVIFSPECARGIYATWPECEARIKGVPGARFQKAATREDARALLAGETRALAPGLYAIVDGNHHGGIGLVLLDQQDGTAPTQREFSTTLAAVFPEGIPVSDGAPIPAEQALGAIRNVAAELGALAFALRHVPVGATVTVVHDYQGVGEWMEGRWRTKDAIVAALVAECRRLVALCDLQVSYQHQAGHQADRLGLDPLIQANRKADALAAAATR
jgi:ribonuclease HI